ncbi:MerR family transcriptional regulator [Algicella marina]|uniref:MerR family transcriptional regulator n=1 Tax=Algicella marina TaxID=2683284 RepID=A0A6P1SUZ2_9RHOB|nr:MerR family transcriptional regulator [Algicella marina]QHQ34268.1 MerR family transcriptional regulator [Algicella marina]
MATVRKSSEAFRTISEVAEILDVPAHVLRFWESRFTQIKPIKRGGGRRYYRPQDIDLLSGIQNLLYNEGMTIKGVQKQLKENGAKQVAALGTVSLNEDSTAPASPPPAPVTPAPTKVTAADTPANEVAKAMPAKTPVAATEPPAALPDPRPTPRPIRIRREPEAPRLEDDRQFDLFAREEEKSRRPFPPDPRQQARAEEIRKILARLSRLRARMAQHVEGA